MLSFKSLSVYLILFCLFKSGFSRANNIKIVEHSQALGIDMYLEIELLENKWRPSPLLEKFRIKKRENRKLTAALLAFPFPFGIVGLHRIYLGTAPSVPVVYIGTLGGVFGLVPLIDCCILLANKNIEEYSNNKKVFMWIK